MSKIIVAFVLVIVFFVGTFYMYYQIGLLKGTAPPKVNLASLPKKLGSWKAEEDKKVKSREFRAIQAKEVLNRDYVDLVGKQTTLHMGIFTEFWNEVPHSPLVCYPSSGWTKEETTPEEVTVSEEPPVKLNAMYALLDREGRREMIMFWYQLGDLTFYDTAGLQEAQGKLRDCDCWPSIIKVLLQTNASNKEQAKRRLTELGSLVYSWSSQMQEGKPSTPPEKEK